MRNHQTPNNNCHQNQLVASKSVDIPKKFSFIFFKNESNVYVYNVCVYISTVQVAGIRDQASYDAAREPLLLMGVYFQAQDDYLDAFAPPETLGKIGTDIQEIAGQKAAKGTCCCCCCCSEADCMNLVPCFRCRRQTHQTAKIKCHKVGR